MSRKSSWETNPAFVVLQYLKPLLEKRNQENWLGVVAAWIQMFVTAPSRVIVLHNMTFFAFSLLEL